MRIVIRHHRLPKRSISVSDDEMTDEYKILLAGWLKGHAEAIAFIETVYCVIHTCDDLTDRDKTVMTNEVQDSYWHALIELPRNAFYIANFALLNGTLQLAYLNWQIANRMEVDDVLNGKEIAYTLRSSYVDLVTICAWILGGKEWAVQVGYASRLHAGHEGLDAYKVALTRERRAPAMVEG